MTILKYIYKSIFGKDHGAVWQQFAKQIGGTYSPISDDSVQFYYKDFKVSFDAYTHYTNVGGSSCENEYTRGLVEFISPDKFKLLIPKERIIEFNDNVLMKRIGNEN